MKLSSPTLFVEINKENFIFLAFDISENNKFELLHKNSIPIQGIYEKKISDFQLVIDLFKKNIYSIEKELNFTFKEVVLLIDNFDCSLINFSGYKKLNGSQLLKENITYLLNSLKFKINETEKNKKILHIFNSKFLLDKKSIDNLPLGLFGNFYSHELSFFLIDNNDYKNLNNILNNCNLKIKKIIAKNFIEGVNLINENKNLNTFFKIQINQTNSHISFFENSSLKFFQEFKFGSNLIIKDISKVIGLNIDEVKNIINSSNLISTDDEDENIEKKFFRYTSFRKIKKSLINEIANARIQEISELIITKNINISSFLKNNILIFLIINDEIMNAKFRKNHKLFFSHNNKFEINFLKEDDFNNLYFHANNVVQYGWNKEALPVVNEKKSIIARVFEFFFN